MLTQARLKELLHYNPYTGVFTWRVNRGGVVKAGNRAGYVVRQRYRTICVDGRHARAHVLAWLYVHGAYATRKLDHKNRKRDDNRIANLRKVTHTVNCQNKSVYKNNKSGQTGVHWHKRDRIWCVNIRVNKVLVHLGYFERKRDAILARKNAELKYFGFHQIKGPSNEPTQYHRRRKQRPPRHEVPRLRSSGG